MTGWDGARGLLRAVFAAMLLGMSPAGAQDLGSKLGVVQSPVLVLDRARLFNQTLYGRRILSEVEAANVAMAEETAAIQAELAAEEQALTQKRAEMEPAAFRALAEQFDARVQQLREEREAAQNEIRAVLESAQLQFFNVVGPILGAIVRERGAVMIVDQRALVLSAYNIDITNDAIARIDAVLGDGAQEAPPLPDGVGDDGRDVIDAPTPEGAGDAVPVDDQ